MGVVSREIETVVAGRVLHLAVTVSSLGPRRANTGYVLVLDDLTEMLRAQKSAAWQEVARRIAHEIKNPLTPIQLSSQRLSRFLDRRAATHSVNPQDAELTNLVQECSRLIEREVSTLAALVNEFSQFVRFPTAKLATTNANTIVHEAVEVFSGRLDGITLKTTLADNLPSVRADGGLLRSVVVNLIDNAAEALENSARREIVVSTRAHSDAETIEICVSDTGHGISLRREMQGVPLGDFTLQVLANHPDLIVMQPHGATSFDGTHIVLDPSMPHLDPDTVHETLHFLYDRAGLTSNAVQQWRDDDAELMLDEETDAQVLGILYNRQWKSQVPSRSRMVKLEDVYERAYSKASLALGQTDLTAEERDLAAHVAGWFEVRQGFANGTVYVSATNTSYPDYYKQDWYVRNGYQVPTPLPVDETQKPADAKGPRVPHPRQHRWW